MKLDFTNKTVLITGATRGIGKQIAEDLHKLGANLILTGTNVNEIKDGFLILCALFKLYFKNVKKYLEKQ